MYRRRYSPVSHAMCGNLQQDGFTIVELMIATLVFSVILLVVTMGVLSFTHAYYSGVNSSATQNTARTIVSTITQAVEFSGTTINATKPVGGGSSIYYFCANNQTYVFIPGLLYDADSPTAANPGLFQASTSACDPAAVNYAQGKELLGRHMRVAELSVAPGVEPRTYTVKVKLAYGDSDLLCTTSKNGSTGGCAAGDASNNGDVSTIVQGDGVTCHLQTGFQFCAVAGLTTTVGLRVSSSVITN